MHAAHCEKERLPLPELKQIQQRYATIKQEFFWKQSTPQRLADNERLGQALLRDTERLYIAKERELREKQQELKAVEDAKQELKGLMERIKQRKKILGVS